MNEIIRKLAGPLVKNPRNLFLIDSIGAVFTALLLFTVLRTYNACFGIPEQAITIMLCTACCLSFYSAACFIFLKKKWELFITIISFANMFYCLLTLFYLCVYNSRLTVLGFTYFITETAVIFNLALLELHVSNRIKNLIQ